MMMRMLQLLQQINCSSLFHVFQQIVATVATVATNQLKSENCLITTVIVIVNMIHQCQYCNYQSPYKQVVRRHEEKHGNAVQSAATHQHTSNPHPHVHSYLNHTNHSIPSNWIMEQHPHEYEYAKYSSNVSLDLASKKCSASNTKLKKSSLFNSSS